ncbi:GyrI-like domain-containing protein [Bacillus sp. mrc49]|uniref:GyrI-like domain-containing protein n=1 Tax=Bacillus sp. mrc49 TaxID=2054913 RepID=UPI000C27E7D9|nr:effector binding domain-containing protein [Bacillus sp. mrc49]PJN89921.1 AraC family transcriptional regulator [Bacillus sp. mrc49]
MKLKVINSIRTNNFNDERLMQRITELWQKASDRLADQKGITYAVYHKYESDYKGDYSLSITVEEDDGEPSLEIPNNAKYEIFIVDTTVEHGVINTWKEIWAREDSGTLDRAYSFDFEKYYPNGEIEVYIALR